ncbi:L-Aspartase-like protein [Stachybotrys elegans]|uniref:L-Aspartase-like protein n=1 Tax=Stachybotrys elegans TaxID=80388 RepID=A0A8K0SH86_9HYPO|nr:L-Aspartase-like protein [Stachybotrys elegans]
MTGSKSSPHTASVLQIWRDTQVLKKGQTNIVLDGNSLSIAAVIAAARHGAKPAITSDQQLHARLELGVKALEAYTSREWVVYGVNTGFGGSADTRTKDLLGLQISVLQHTQSAIIAGLDKAPGDNSEREPPHVLPMDWVRGAMLVRANQNLRGHSAIRLNVLESLVKLLEHDITPLVPLRGTISASGDLMPMSYIAGAVTGNPDIYVQVGKGKDAKVLPSSEALSLTGLSPSGLGPKEALGLINGTAPSVAAASLVLYDAQKLALLAQMLTAFAAESLGGNVEWTHPFIHAIRPHPGQVEAASNIRRFLQGSKLVVGLESRKREGEGLWQDRYSTRTSPQWMGPYLEDLLLAQRQLETELNSTSDNPLVDVNESDVGNSEVYSGGNFQATVVTSAMDKTRLALQMIGRMLFSQVTEMINPATNNGLEANLNASDRENFTMKGIDVNMAAYMAELASLAHPVSSHVMSAEMHNQGINSLALLTARRTMEAADIVAHMCACHLYVSCQAVDMRSTHTLFLSKVREDGLGSWLRDLGLDGEQMNRLGDMLWPTIETTWYHWNANSWKDRIPYVVDAVMGPVTEFLHAEQVSCSVSQLQSFKRLFATNISSLASSIFYPNLALAKDAVAAQLGDGTAQLYAWVRSRLAVPTHYGLDDDPLYARIHELESAHDKKSIGTWVTKIYESLREDMMDMVLEGLESTRAGPRSEKEFDELCKKMQKKY